MLGMCSIDECSNCGITLLLLGTIIFAQVRRSKDFKLGGGVRKTSYHITIDMYPSMLTTFFSFFSERADVKGGQNKIIRRPLKINLNNVCVMMGNQNDV